MRTTYAILAWLVVATISSHGFAQTRPATRPSVTPRPEPPRSAQTAVVKLHGEINDFNGSSFIRSFNIAKATGAKVIIVDIDTYGGMVTSALEISHFLKQQNDVHTIAYIEKKAISAGALISIACNEIVMGEYAKIGDCAPIMVGKDGSVQPLPDTERAKAESPILADFQESAQRNGYPIPLVMSMVTLRPVYYVDARTESGKVERRYMAISTEKYKEGEDKHLWKPVPGTTNPVLIADSLLTVNGRRAKELGIASELAPSLEAIASARSYSIVGTFGGGIGQQILAVLNSPVSRGLLIAIFLVCLYVSLHAPGHGLAEVTAAVSLAALVGVPLLTGYAQWWEIVLILLGVGLLALEIFIIPGFGIAGFAGIALMLIGFLLTFIAPEPGRSPLSIPRMPITWQSLQTGLMAVVGGMFCALFLSWWIRRYLPKLPYFNRLILNTTVGGSEAAMVGSLSNIDPNETVPAVGAGGVTVTDLRPGGSAQFTDPAGAAHAVSVVCDSGFVVRGTRIVVVEVAGNRIVVRPAG